MEASLKELESLGYLVSGLRQNCFGSWDLTFRSPYAWKEFTVNGGSATEAATKAARKARKLGPAVDMLKVSPGSRRTRLSAKEKPAKRRVRLRSGRVRL